MPFSISRSRLPYYSFRFAVALFALWAVAGCRASSLSPAAAAADTATLRSDVTFLASDLLAGRGTGTPGYDSAAA
ncbi:MAG TPA: hypothetical protein VMM77_07735, partial [Gemmatimonadaceae bacterium]|nr:hypothetical protein [Gemmatimonadaceae bacterium]